jgi:HEAT repeat protein
LECGEEEEMKTPRGRSCVAYPFLAGLLVLAGGCAKTPPTMAHGRPVEHWVQALQGRDTHARQKAVRVLGNVGPSDPAAVPALARAAADPAPAVRREAVRALLKLGPAAAEALPALERCRKDPDAQVRRDATLAVQRLQAGP